MQEDAQKYDIIIPGVLKYAWRATMNQLLTDNEIQAEPFKTHRQTTTENLLKVI